MRRIFFLSLLAVSCLPAQTLLLRESFGFGVNYERPKSGKGRMTATTGGLSGFWAEYPSNKNTAWMTVDGQGSAGWRWASSTQNPYQDPSPLENPSENGLAWCSCEQATQSALLVPFASPRAKFRVSANLLPNPTMGHSSALGLSNSNVLQDNFETSAAVWVRLRMDVAGDSSFGLAELRTRGLAGPSAALRVPVIYSGFNQVELEIDALALTATAKVNGITIGSVAIPSGSTRYVGFEGSGGVDNLVIRTIN